PARPDPKGGAVGGAEGGHLPPRGRGRKGGCRGGRRRGDYRRERARTQHQRSGRQIARAATMTGLSMRAAQEPAATASSRASAEVRPAPELTVVVPTLNERENVPKLVERIGAALLGIDWELMFVDDDSSDDTAGNAQTQGRSGAPLRRLPPTPPRRRPPPRPPARLARHGPS